MEQTELKFDGIPSSPSSAATHFFSVHMPVISAHLASSRGDLTLILPLADTRHDDWRRAAARDLAREHAPIRVNIIGGGNSPARAKALAYLRDAPGITGQYLPLS